MQNAEIILYQSLLWKPFAWSAAFVHKETHSGVTDGKSRWLLLFWSPLSTRGGHRHLQIGRMLDIDLIPDLRLICWKEWKVELFQKTEIKDPAFYCTSNFALEDRTVLSSTIDLLGWGGGRGGGTHKSTTGSLYLYIKVRESVWQKGEGSDS